MHQCWAPRYPPGPMPLPGLSNLLQVDFQDTLCSSTWLRCHFGDVFSLQLAWMPVVVLKGLAAMREVLVERSEDTADRPLMPVFQHRGFGPHVLGNPNALLNKAVGNVIASLTFGRCFEYKDSRFLKLLDLTEMTQDPAQTPRDLTDAFLDEVEKAKGNSETTFNVDNLHLLVTDLFFTRTVTTSTTLARDVLLMILHPDMQRRVQQEIDEVIGQARRPEMGDQTHMPFTMAVVHEVQCFGDIIPLGLPHMTSRDIEVQSFLIPKVGLWPPSPQLSSICPLVAPFLAIA
ncbi:hypothetical protein HPG69_018702, partial [Diceros bicornis minor]